MSKIGKDPVKIPAGVEIKTEDNNIYGGISVLVSGPRGDLRIDMQPGITFQVVNEEIVFDRDSDEKQLRAYHGLYRSIVNNAVIGVTQGYEKKLEIQGIGYKAELNGNKLSLKVGYSHPIIIEAPAGINFELKDPVNITVSGIDKQKVTEYAAKIRKVRKPEPYKGKGIRYAGEVVRRKQGKTAGSK